MIHHFFDGKPWFRPKTFGLGAVPSTWQGWALTCAYCAAVLGFTVSFDGDSIAANPFWWLGLSALTALFFLIVWIKTDGGWHWHWGVNDGNRHDIGNRAPFVLYRGPGIYQLTPQTGSGLAIAFIGIGAGFGLAAGLLAWLGPTALGFSVSSVMLLLAMGLQLWFARSHCDVVEVHREQRRTKGTSRRRRRP